MLRLYIAPPAASKTLAVYPVGVTDAAADTQPSSHLCSDFLNESQ
ncbi:MAG: hypothetical protein RIM23_27265 [Coleofasciculus sp. G3-WIS-01]